MSLWTTPFGDHARCGETFAGRKSSGELLAANDDAGPSDTRRPDFARVR